MTVVNMLDFGFESRYKLGRYTYIYNNESQVICWVNNVGSADQRLKVMSNERRGSEMARKQGVFPKNKTLKIDSDYYKINGHFFPLFYFFQYRIQKDFTQNPSPVFVQTVSSGLT